MATKQFKLNVNGKNHDVTADEDMPLLYALRNDISCSTERLGTCSSGICTRMSLVEQLFSYRFMSVSSDTFLSCTDKLARSFDRQESLYNTQCVLHTKLAP